MSTPFEGLLERDTPTGVAELSDWLDHRLQRHGPGSLIGNRDPVLNVSRGGYADRKVGGWRPRMERWKPLFDREESLQKAAMRRAIDAMTIPTVDDVRPPQ